MKCVFLLLVSIAGFSAFAQLDIPVDHSTGKPIITIPLYTANDRTLSHQISIIYNTLGVKVDAGSSPVGQNWTLSAGGEISRELRGLPDDYTSTSPTDLRRGWLLNSNASTIGNFGYPADGSLLSCTTEPPVYNFINGFNHNQDTEPDMFYFSAGDISGSFVFDNTGQIDNVRLIPYQDMKVKPYQDANSKITKFEITTAQGVRYTFSEQVVAKKKTKVIYAGSGDPIHFRKEYHQYKTELQYVSAWKLTKIESPTSEVISFGYGEYQESNSTTDIRKAIQNSADLTKHTNKYLYSVEQTFNTRELSLVTTPHQSILFSYTGSTTLSSKFILKTIAVREKVGLNFGTEDLVKSINFQHLSTQTSIASETEGATKRPFLYKLFISDGCQEHEHFRFDYYGVSNTNSTVALPPPQSSLVDIWGYYKQMPSNDKIPTTYIYPLLSGIKKVSVYRIPNQGNEIVVEGVDRLNEETPIAGTLSQITYPSGATAAFTYEPHEFYNPIISGVSRGAGLRIASITLHDGISTENNIVKAYEYKKPDGTTSGNLLAAPGFWQIVGCYQDPSNGAITDYPALSSTPISNQWKRLIVRSGSNLNPDFDLIQPVFYERVTEKVSANKGKSVFLFDVPFVYGSFPSNDWNPTYMHVARSSSCPNPALNTPGYYYAPYAPQTPYSFGGGQLKRESHYAEGVNNPVKETVYEYQNKTVSPVIVKGLRYEFIPLNATAYHFMYGAFTLSTNKLKVLTKTTERILDRVNLSSYMETVTDYTYGADHALESSVQVTNSDFSVLISKKKYARDYGLPSSLTGSQQVNCIDSLNRIGYYGALIEQASSMIYPGQVEKFVQGELTTYKYLGTTGTGNDIPVLRAKEKYVFDAEGIPIGAGGFQMSSFSGSGASRTFLKNSTYRKVATFWYDAFKDISKVADDKRQVHSVHHDLRTGLTVSAIENADPGEVIYSGFDHDTNFDFDLTGFLNDDRYNTPGRNGAYALGGWKNGNGKYLSRANFKKRPGSKYIFSAWYKAPVASGTHIITVKIKSISNAVLLTDNTPVTVVSTDWIYVEKVIDLSGIADEKVNVEVSLTGSYTSSSASVLDDVTFVPDGVLLERTAFHTAHGPLAVLMSNGQVTEIERDKSGRIKLIRDRNRNILEKKTYANWLAVGTKVSPVKLSVPTELYINEATAFTASYSCLEYTAMEWSVAKRQGSSTGFFSGSENLPYTFTSAGIYDVTFRISHPSYGAVEISKPVIVNLLPTQTIIQLTGETSIDVCPPRSQDNIFTASIQNCSSTNVEYTWFMMLANGVWQFAGTGNTFHYYSNIDNPWSYQVKCVATLLSGTGCGQVKESVPITVNIFNSCP
jgi:hypothetical protein